MTGGGACFGGGEPTLYPEFIRQFRKVCGNRWRITVETALTCTEDVITEMARSVDRWIVDVKDLSEEIYEGYTGKRNDIRSRQKVLLDAGAETTVRVPHIPGYDGDGDVAKTIGELRSIRLTPSTRDRLRTHSMKHYPSQLNGYISNSVFEE